MKFVYGANDRSSGYKSINDRSEIFSRGMRFNNCIVSFTVLCLLFGGILSIYESKLQNHNGQGGIEITIQGLFNLSLSIKGKTRRRNYSRIQYHCIFFKSPFFLKHPFSTHSFKLKHSMQHFRPIISVTRTLLPWNSASVRLRLNRHFRWHFHQHTCTTTYKAT